MKSLREKQMKRALFEYERFAERTSKLAEMNFYISAFNFLKRNVRLHGQQTFLDVGCGKGDLMSLVKTSTSSSDLVGVDVSTRMLREARFKGVVHCIHADALNLPIRDETIDVVISSEVVEHVVDPVRLLRELKRVSKRHSFTLLTFPNCLPHYLGPYQLLRFFPLHVKRKLPSILKWSIPYGDPSKTEQPIDNLYTSIQVLKWLRRVDFKIIKTSSEMQMARPVGLERLRNPDVFLRTIARKILGFLPVTFHYGFFIIARK